MVFFWALQHEALAAAKGASDDSRSRGRTERLEHVARLVAKKHKQAGAERKAKREARHEAAKTRRERTDAEKVN